MDRLHHSLASIHWEVIFVDDNSQDGTPELIESISQTDFRVRLIRRLNRRGLSSAVIEGMMATAAPYVAVMDADLQHDETLLPKMFDLLTKEQWDVVVASRVIDGGSSSGLSPLRSKISDFCSQLARRVFHTNVKDMMSGFFMLNKTVILEVAPRLSGIGFKVLADILASSTRPLKVIEIPYHFRERLSGISKLDLRVASDYLLLLIDKKVGRWIPARLISYVAVGSIGAILHFSVLWMFYRIFLVKFIIAQSIASAIAITNNFALNNVFTYSDLRLKGKKWLLGWISFALVSLIGAIGNVGVSNFLFNNAIDWKLSAIVGILIGVIWNFSMTRAYTWRAVS